MTSLMRLARKFAIYMPASRNDGPRRGPALRPKKKKLKVPEMVVRIPALAVAVIVAFIASAIADEQQVGRWAVDAEHCRYGGDSHQTAPLTVTPTALKWAAESCTIGKMYKADRALYIEGRCQNSAGLLTKHPITPAMKGQRLAVTWNGEHTEMQRCP